MNILLHGRADRPRRLPLWMPALTVVAAAVLAIESLVFVWVHVQYREIPPIILSGVQAFAAGGGRMRS